MAKIRMTVVCEWEPNLEYYPGCDIHAAAALDQANYDDNDAGVMDFLETRPYIVKFEGIE